MKTEHQNKDLDAICAERAAVIQAIGWCWAEACGRTARGENICQVEGPEILERAMDDGIVPALDTREQN